MDPRILKYEPSLFSRYRAFPWHYPRTVVIASIPTITINIIITIPTIRHRTIILITTLS